MIMKVAYCIMAFQITRFAHCLKWLICLDPSLPRGVSFLYTGAVSGVTCRPFRRPSVPQNILQERYSASPQTTEGPNVHFTDCIASLQRNHSLGDRNCM